MLHTIELGWKFIDCRMVWVVPTMTAQQAGLYAGWGNRIPPETLLIENILMMLKTKVEHCLSSKVIQLNPEVERGRLVYRAKGSKRRISYLQIKRGLIKKNYSIQIDLPEWFFK